jgi:hypothetical protein
MTILLILLYLIGCSLTLFRIAASEHAIDEKYINWLEPRYTSLSDVGKEKINIVFISLSWIGLFAGLMQYLLESEEQEKMFIFSYKFKNNDKRHN